MRKITHCIDKREFYKNGAEENEFLKMRNMMTKIKVFKKKKKFKVLKKNITQEENKKVKYQKQEGRDRKLEAVQGAIHLNNRNS